MSSAKRNTQLVWMLSAYEKICSSRGYTKLGVEAVCAKVLSVFLK